MMDNKNRVEFTDEIPLPYKQPLSDTDVNDIDNEIDVVKKDVKNVGPTIDLSNDIFVNDIMLADGAPPNPYAEAIYL